MRKSAIIFILLIFMCFPSHASDLKSKKSDFTPDLRSIEDEATKKFGGDVVSVITNSQRDVHDDLSALNEDKMEWKGSWATATDYELSDVAINDGKCYVCIEKHISSGTDEPGTGEFWTTYWALIADYAADSDTQNFVQIVNVMDGAYATGSVLIPNDDSKPEIDEGTEFMTLAITPTSASNKLLIEVVWNGCHATPNHIYVALFETTTDAQYALACAGGVPTSNTEPMNISFKHYMTAPGTGTYTFRVRAGGPETQAVYFNGKAADRNFGGAYASSITIIEIKP